MTKSRFTFGPSLFLFCGAVMAPAFASAQPVAWLPVGDDAAPVAPDESAADDSAEARQSGSAAAREAGTPAPTRAEGGNQAVATVVVQSPDRFAEVPPYHRPQDDEGSPRTLHGLRLGYMNWLRYDQAPNDADDPDARSPAEALDLESPHMFVVGYEVAKRLSAGSDDLNILLVGNVMVAGIEQSKLLPTGNAIIGFELRELMQLGVGANLAPVGLDDKFAHMIVAAGWTPRSGDLYLPVHLFFVPDVDGHHRIGLTFGVTWER